MSKKNGRFEGRKLGEPLSTEHQRLLDWHQDVRFKRCLFGGVRESDVWRKIGELNALYEQALNAERIRYDALLQGREKEAVCEEFE